MEKSIVEMLKTELGCGLYDMKNDDITTYMDIEASKIVEACELMKREAEGILASMFAVDESVIGKSAAEKSAVEKSAAEKATGYSIAGESVKGGSKADASAYSIYYVFSLRNFGKLLVLKTALAEPSIASISNELPAAGLYEREIQEMFGISFTDSPDARRLVLHENWPEGQYPLKKDFNINTKPPFANGKYQFAKVEGTGVFEVPVGPVHAGIIEPGHFRFSVAGEPIINLEGRLGYVHKGIEKLAENQDFSKVLFISERISGDETVSNSLAYCQAIERLTGMPEVPAKALYLRTILCELERIYNHLGDIAGICTDVAYSFAAYQFNMMRRWQMILDEELTGSRILRSSVKPGGVRWDFLKEKKNVLLEGMDKLEKEFIETVEIIKSNNLFIDRVEHTGLIKPEVAADLNAVGPAARSAGVNTDVRKEFPYAAYGKLNFKVSVHNNGDVCCRMNVKIEELLEAINIIRAAAQEAPAEGKVLEPVKKLEPFKSAFGLTEAPRGENIHWVMSGENNTIYRYKIRTPSFCNWPVLCHAVKGNVIPDFPLINKSFNLSYSGNDL